MKVKVSENENIDWGQKEIEKISKEIKNINRDLDLMKARLRVLVYIKKYPWVLLEAK